MENLSNFNEENQLDFSPILTKHVEDIAKWARFLSIVGFIGVVFVILVAIVMAFLPSINAGNEFSQGMDSFPTFMGPFLSFIYIIIAILCFLPVYYLYNFSSKALRAIQVKDTRTIEDSFNNLRRHYKFMGILVIIMLGIYAIGFLGMAMGGMMGAMM